MTVLWIIGVLALLVGLVLGIRVLVKLADHIVYFLPPTAIAELAKQMQSEVALVRTYSLAMNEQVMAMTTVLEQTSHVTNTLDLLRDGMSSQINQQVDQWLRRHGRDLFDDVIRNASLRVANNIEMGLVERTTDVLGEYVLLQSVENLSIDVSLHAQYTQPEQLREAIVRVIKWHPLRQAKRQMNDQELAEWFLELTDNRRKLDQFLGKLGEELLTLQWAGKVALHCKREIPVTEGSIKSVHSA